MAVHGDHKELVAGFGRGRCTSFEEVSNVISARRFRPSRATRDVYPPVFEVRIFGGTHARAARAVKSACARIAPR